MSTPTATDAQPDDPIVSPQASYPQSEASPVNASPANSRHEKSLKWKNHHHSKNNPPPPTNCVVLKNLDYNITQLALEEVVRQVTGGRKNFFNVTLIDDKATGTFRGMAFVNFHNVPDASAALTELARMVINGRKVVAEYRRLRPGERERKEAKEKAARDAREAKAAEAKAKAEAKASKVKAAETSEDVHSKQTCNSAEDNADDASSGDSPKNSMSGTPTPKQIDKRALFFAKRENARENARRIDDSKREVSAEQAERDKVREAEFRKLLLEYSAGSLEGGEAGMVKDLVFDSSLTSYERRMVHTICTELKLGHVSRLDEGGNRVLHVTKDLKRAAEWDKEAGAGGLNQHHKKKERMQKELKENGHGKWAGESSKNDGGGGEGGFSREERAGLKWFRPKAVKGNGADGGVGGVLKMPTYKVYTPKRQPIGPDGTVGFESRREYHGVSEATDGDEGDDDVIDENINTSEMHGEDVEKEVDGERSNVKKSSGLDPSVASFSPFTQSM